MIKFLFTLLIAREPVLHVIKKIGMLFFKDDTKSLNGQQSQEWKVRSHRAHTKLSPWKYAFKVLKYEDFLYATLIPPMRHRARKLIHVQYCSFRTKHQHANNFHTCGEEGWGKNNFETKSYTVYVIRYCIACVPQSSRFPSSPLLHHTEISNTRTLSTRHTLTLDPCKFTHDSNFNYSTPKYVQCVTQILAYLRK